MKGMGSTNITTIPEGPWANVAYRSEGQAGRRNRIRVGENAVIDDELLLPEQVRQRAIIRNSEYSWRMADVEEAIEAARAAGLLCLGGDVQFHVEAGVFEAYWLSFASSDRRHEESWNQYVDRAAAEVVSLFRRRCREVDFVQVAKECSSILKQIEDGQLDPLEHLVFTLCFAMEETLEELTDRYPNIRVSTGIHCFHCGESFIQQARITKCESSGMSLSPFFKDRLEELLCARIEQQSMLSSFGKSGLHCPRCGETLDMLNGTGTELECHKCLLRLTPNDVFQMKELHPHNGNQ